MIINDSQDDDSVKTKYSWGSRPHKTLKGIEVYFCPISNRSQRGELIIYGTSRGQIPEYHLEYRGETTLQVSWNLKDGETLREGSKSASLLKCRSALSKPSTIVPNRLAAEARKKLIELIGTNARKSGPESRRQSGWNHASRITMEEE